MRSPRFNLTARGLAPNRPFTARENRIAKVLASVREFRDEQHRDLCAALHYLERDSITSAFEDLVTALRCDHLPCNCLLKHQDPRDIIALASFNSCAVDGSALLARAFTRWCWRHERTSMRACARERPSSEDDWSNGEGGTVMNSLDHRAESLGLYASDKSSAERCEEWVEGTDLHSVLEVIFSRAPCSERDIDTYVDIKSRRKRAGDKAAEENERTAACRANRAIRAYLASRGIFNREDFTVAIEEGEFLAKVCDMAAE